MAPLLAVESKGKKHIFKVELDANTAEGLRLYCAFAQDASQNSVFKEALNHVFKMDTEFQEWKKNPENLKNVNGARTRGRRKGAPATAPAPSDNTLTQGKTR